MVGRLIIEKWPKISGCVGCWDPKSEWKCKLVSPHELQTYLEPICAILGLFATYLGLIKAYLGHYGPIWSRFGSIWAYLEPIWTISDPIRAYLSHFGPNQGLFEPFWTLLGHFGPNWSLFGFNPTPKKLSARRLSPLIFLYLNVCQFLPNITFSVHGDSLRGDSFVEIAWYRL